MKVSAAITDFLSGDISRMLPDKAWLASNYPRVSSGLMSTLKLIGLGIAWALASVAIAVVAAILITEIFDVVGVVESGETSYTIVINLVLLVVFIGLVLIPFVFRDRFVAPSEDEAGK